MIAEGERSRGEEMRLAKQGLAPPGGEHERLEEQLDGRDVHIGDRQRHDRGVQVALAHALDQGCGHVLVERQLDVRVALEQLAQDQRDQVRPDGRDRAEAQPAAERPAPQAAQVDQLVADPQQLARPLDHARAQRRDHNAAVGALEDLDPEQLLDLAHLDAQRRLADVAARRSAAEVALFGHRHDVLEIAQVQSGQGHPDCIAAFRAIRQRRLPRMPRPAKFCWPWTFAGSSRPRGRSPKRQAGWTRSAT